MRLMMIEFVDDVDVVVVDDDDVDVDVDLFFFLSSCHQHNVRLQNTSCHGGDVDGGGGEAYGSSFCGSRRKL